MEVIGWGWIQLLVAIILVLLIRLVENTAMISELLDSLIELIYQGMQEGNPDSNSPETTQPEKPNEEANI